VAALGAACWCGCEQKPAPTTTTAASASAAAAQAPLDRVSREDFNRIAAELALPLFWKLAEKGEKADKALGPKRLAVLWGVDQTSYGDWVKDGRFTPRFVKAYDKIAAIAKDGHPASQGLGAEEAKRRELVHKELGQGVHRLIQWDFRDVGKQDRAIMRHLMKAAQHIETIFAKQNGWDGMSAKVPADDRASRMLFYRNQGPHCEAPSTEHEPSCSALASLPKQVFGLYPPSLQSDPDFCSALGKRPDGQTLLGHFAVVRGEGDALRAVPYNEAYATEVKAIATELRAAAAAITDDDEKAFKAYLLGAAKAFEDNDWEAADELWAKMNAQNSRWYLRIGPDEVYFEPCNTKAGFHMSLARINRDSIKLQSELDPLKNDMEKALAEKAGPPYQAREVSFHLPDFIDMVLNAGDSRSPHGATIGQSLPNWGPVANEGRGRTVAMTNLYTDADSRASLERQASSLLCSATMAKFTSDKAPLVLSTVLHEAAHNLGPSHEYAVGGKVARDIFGGPMASTLEELKAQTAALFLTRWLVDQKRVTAAQADRANVRDMVWAFGHISRGMYTPTGKPKSYSQLAAIQLSFLRNKGAVEYRADEQAANGKDKGCLEIHLDKFPAAVEELMSLVGGIKARGDKAAAEALIREFVDDEGEHKALREPKATFVYSIRL